MTAHLATRKDEVQPLLVRAYRDPAAARARLDEMLRASWSAEEVAADLQKQGPALLGKLRGRKGIFASALASAEREAAEIIASDIPRAVRQPGRLRTELETIYRDQLERDRLREQIEVPGLSAEALAAIAPLQQSADCSGLPVQDVPVKNLRADEIARAGRVAPVWSAIQADEPVRAELARFRQAVDERLGDRLHLGSDPVAGRVSALAGLLAQAERLTARHAAVQAARTRARGGTEPRPGGDRTDVAAPQGAAPAIQRAGHGVNAGQAPRSCPLKMVAVSATVFRATEFNQLRHVVRHF